MKRVYADINPDTLKWARNRARSSPEQIAGEVGTGLDRYLKWETGDAKPTIRQLSRLVRVFNRSLQLIYMKEIPDEPEPLAETRRLPGSTIGEESPELAEQVYLTVEKRDIALRLYGDTGEDPPRHSLNAKLDDDPEHLGADIRETLSVSLEDQVAWKDGYEALREWRFALESVGVLVFQIPGLTPAPDWRGGVP